MPRRALSARIDIPLDAMAPFSSTGMPSPTKNARPSELVTVGPLKPCITSTGCAGVTASSSWRVGMRGTPGGGVNWLTWKPPSAVSHWPAGISRARAANVACTSAIERAFSIRVSWPGRRPSSTMWLWLSMMPGTTVRPRRLISRVHSSSPLRASPPTAAKRPLRISTEDTTRSFASMVWILPWTRRSALPSGQRSSRSLSFANAGGQLRTAASAPAAAKIFFMVISSSGRRPYARGMKI
jgi:hypothetical protein